MKTTFFILTLLAFTTSASAQYSLRQRLESRAYEVVTRCSGEGNWYYMDVTNLRYNNRRATFLWTYLTHKQSYLSFEYVVNFRGEVIVTDIACE